MATSITSTIVLKVSGKEAENSFSGLSKVVRTLERELKKLTPGTEEFQKKARELKDAREHFERVKNEIDQVNGRLKNSEGFLGKFLSKLAEFGLSFSNIFAVGAAGGLSKVATDLLKVSDAMADVQKTTGMALEEVKALWDAFDEMDTRTSKLDRLKIAEVGGRLGVPKEELASFVQEVDKAYVALGDSFQGGLEAVVDSLGKIKGLFSETKGKSYANAINEVGSALNELASSGTASEGNIADFTLRVGALPDALKPSIDKVLGLGAAFEESGIDSQIAASGYSNFMKVAGENLDKFAYSMNMSIKQAQELFNTNPDEFFLKFSQGMKNLSADETAKVFDSLKLNSLEVQKVVGAAANRTDDFRRAMDLASSSMQEATSLTDEFNKKNNNAAAVWEKLKNVVSDFFSQTTFINGFSGLILFMGRLVGVTQEAGESVHTFKQKFSAVVDIIKVVVASLLGYKLVVMQMTLWEGNYTKAKWLGIVADKAKIAITQTKRAGMLLYAAAKYHLAGNTAKVTQAMSLFNRVIKANPVGLLVGVITAAITAYSLFADEIDKTTEAEKRLLKATQDFMGEASREINSLEQLYKAATDASKGKDAQREAVEKLQRLYPSYFGNIDAELIMLGKAQQKYMDLKDAILASARARAAEKIIQENTEKSLLKEIEIQEKINKRSQEKQAFEKNPNKKVVIDNSSDAEGYALFNNSTETTNRALAKEKSLEIKNLQTELNNLRKETDRKNKEISSLIETDKDKIKAYEKDKAGQTTSISSPTNRVVMGKEKNHKAKEKSNRPAVDKSEKESQTAYERALNESGKLDKQLLEAFRKMEDEKFKIIQDSEEKEKSLRRLQHQREIEDLKIKNKDIFSEIEKNNAEISKLQTQKSKSQSPEARSNYQKAIDELRKANEKKTELISQNNILIQQMEQTHQSELNKITEKHRLEREQKFQEAKQREIEAKIYKAEQEILAITSLEEAKKRLSESYSGEELAKIRTLEDAKKALRKEAQIKILKEQELAIKEQMAALSQLIADPSFSEEAREKLKKDLEEFKTKLQSIKGQIQGNEERKQAEEQNAREQAKKNTDILGFSAAEWEEMFENLNSTEGRIKGIIMATQALSNAFRMFSQFQQNLNERELRKFTQNQDKKKLALLKQLNQGLITQEQYHKGIQALEDETAEKKRQMQRRAAKAEKAANMFSAISGTANAVVQALKAGPVAGPILAGIVGALGAVQIGIIAAQPLPEFARGGFTGGGSGKADRTGFKPAGIVHEQEYVTPKWMLENPVVADVVGWMESIRTGRVSLPKGYAEGGTTTGNARIAEPQALNTQPINSIDPQMMSILSETKDLLSHLKENGVEAYIIENAENGKKIKQMINLFEKIQLKNARKNI